MKSLRVHGCILLFISLSFPTNAQDFGSIYGLEPLLHNGRIYSFTLSNETIGHPFLKGQNYESGCVFIGNEKFEDQLLNYDIYNQELLLEYHDIHGAFNVIKLSKAWLRGFRLHDDEFVLLETENGQKEFFQVIGCDSLKVLFHWRKSMSLTKEVGKTNYHFSEPMGTGYLFSDGAFYKFRNNRSFLDYFEPFQRDAVKQYLSQNKINVRRASDEKMMNLVTFCNRIRD